MSPKPIVGYFAARGRAEPIRLLLRYAGVDFEDKRYAFDMKTHTSEWYDVKFKLGLDFPTVPYYIEGDLKMTQSLAILRHLGRKYNMEGTTETEKNRIAMLEQQVADLFTAMARLKFRPKGPAVTDEEKAEFDKKLNVDFEQLDRFIGSNKFSTGENISYVDFWLYEYLHNIHGAEFVVKETVDKFANVKRFEKTIESLPQISAYLKDINSKPDF
ncbi:Glutathione S-transferase Mu 3 [Blomia tropicalis]|nr:Glutathione S-transferase Mu 3 [Blomia tropicalis]